MSKFLPSGGDSSPIPSGENSVHCIVQQVKHLLNILLHCIKVDKLLLKLNHQKELAEDKTTKFIQNIKFMKLEILFAIRRMERKNGEGQAK